MNSSSYAQFQLVNADKGSAIWTLTLCSTLVIIILSYLYNRPDNTSHIPFAGSTGSLTSYIEAARYFLNAPGVLKKNYREHRPGLFRVPQFDRWAVVATDAKHIEEITSAPEDSLSFVAAVEEVLQAQYTLQFKLHEALFPIIKCRLTRSLGKLFPDIRDEIVQACSDLMTPGDSEFNRDSEWRSIRPLDTMTYIVSRTSSRIFVGLPKCRDADYNNLCIRFTADVMAASSIINFFPASLKWLPALLFNRAPRTIRRAYKHLKPLIVERRQGLNHFGPDWQQKPNDLLTWFMEDEYSGGDDPWELTKKIMSINFTAIHTSSVSLTHALFHLVCRPEYISILREEIDQVVKDHGWTKHSLNQMRKLDSFLKEAQRMNGPGAISMFRKAVRPYTLSDGTKIPAGTLLLGASSPLHFDDAIYEDASSFDGMRFYNKGPNSSNRMVSPSLEYLAFGYGKLACPGRFFAVTEIKTVMAHIISEYDVKLKNPSRHPVEHWVGTACLPNMHTDILVRRRIRE